MIDKHAEYADNVIEISSMNLALLKACADNYKSAIKCSYLSGYKIKKSVKNQYNNVINKINKEIEIEKEKIAAATQLKSVALRCKANEKLNLTAIGSGLSNDFRTDSELRLLKQKRYELEALFELRSNND